MGLGSEAVLYDTDGSPLAIDNGVAIPADTPLIMIGGSDGTVSRYIKIDSSGRQIAVGAGTAGSPSGGIITIQGDPSGTPLPISGNITASNVSVGTNDAAIPGFSTLIAGSDGTSLRPLRIFDLDSGAGQQWILGVGLRKSAGGGSVEFGTSSDPIRIDPTGATIQPVSGTIAATQSGSWTVSGSGNFTVVQSTASNLRAQLASESNIASAITSTALLVGGSDGTNLRPVFTDSSGRQIVIGAAANGAAVTGNPVLIGGSDGSNARSIRTANDGTLRVDPTGTTIQPISISGVNIDAGNSSTTPLSGGGSFTGTGIDTSTYANVGVSVFTDRAGTLNLQFSSDNVNWDETISYDVAASDFTRVTTGPQARYFRVNYVNGGGPSQSVFRLQTIEKPVANAPSTVPVATVIEGSNDAIITKSVITGKTTAGGGGYVDVKVNPSGTLTVDISGSTVNQGTSPWVTNVSQFGGNNVVTGTGAAGAGIPRVTVSNDSNILATQSGTWTVQPGNTANSTPWLMTISQGGTSATVTGSNALKVDGSAVTQPVSGTVTSNQGTANTLSNKWPVQITDGTNTMPTGDAIARAIFHKITDGTNTAAVKAASTAAAAADPSLVIAFSPNSPLPTGSNVIGAVTQSSGPWTSNITQFGGNNIVTGTGTGGSGIPRVTVSNDSNILATQSGSWSVTANQGSANTLTNGWPVKVTDGTNSMPTGDTVGRAIFQKITDGTNTAAVKAASTAAVAADPALVVSVSPNTPVVVTSVSPTATNGLVFGQANTGASANTLTSLRATTYTEQTTNAQRSVKSSSANDTNSAGTGARQIKITYFDQAMAGPFTETINLNGTAAVNTVSTTICFIEKIVVVSAGSTKSNQGTITLFTTTAGGGTAIGTIAVGTVVSAGTVGDNQTLWAHHYVATGKTASVYTISSGTTGNQAGISFLRTIDPTSATTIETQITEGIVISPNSGSGSIFRIPGIPVKITGPAKITQYVVSTGSNTVFNGGFEYSES